MKKADLKYATKYAKLVKKNRVYVPGEKISTIWNDNEAHYAFNDNDGKWYEITEKKPLKNGYETVTGRYIVERYLLDDLWECDKVELKYNATNFLICKILPLPYQKCTTMGTAGQWKALLMAWSYENGPLNGKERAKRDAITHKFVSNRGKSNWYELTDAEQGPFIMSAVFK